MLGGELLDRLDSYLYVVSSTYLYIKLTLFCCTTSVPICLTRAYEAGTTQNARSLGRSTVRQRRAPAAATPEAEEGDRQPLAKLKQNRRSTHALFFGTDDIAALKKADEEVADKEKGKEDDDAVTSPSNTTKEEDAEQDSIRNLARDVFRVYFSTDDSHADKSKLKKIQERGIHTKINGTMPYLTAYLTKLQLPGPIAYTLLFIEASLRGMAQVSCIFERKLESKSSLQDF